MSMRIDKSMWSSESKAAALRLERYDHEAASGWIVHVCRQAGAWLPHFFERFDHHDATMPERVPDLHNARIIKCHSQLAAAVDALGKLLPPQLLPPEWLDLTRQFIDRMAVERQLSSGADHPVVQRFWDIVDDILSREKPDDHVVGDSLNQHRDPDRYYAISLISFERKARHAGLIPPDPLDLKKHLRGSRSRKFIAAKNVNNPADRRVHCWVFENPAGAVSLGD